MKSDVIWYNITYKNQPKYQIYNYIIYNDMT